MGGGMLRSVGRTVGAGVGGVQEALSSSKPKPANLLSVSSSSSPSSSSSLTLPVSATSGAASAWRSSSCLCDTDDWVIHQEEEHQVGGEDEFFERFVFGHPPSGNEVEDAVSAIQQVVRSFARVQDRYSSSTNRHAPSPQPEPDWIEPTLHLRDPRKMQLDGYDNAMAAFNLLQINPSVQRMVVSLSSDKAIWDAVMKNEVVREMKQSLCGACPSGSESPHDSNDKPAARILKCILGSAKAKLIEFIDKITKLVNDLFVAPREEDGANPLEETLRSSFMLSIMVLLVVLVARAQRT
ncbi:uncharacterized protein [Aristolochia californica]|uniref:uncharacterized protein n=1 Tax=Aristolochia californica TaxID=171875 RepID=UPI0035D894AC